MVMSVVAVGGGAVEEVFLHQTLLHLGVAILNCRH